MKNIEISSPSNGLVELFSLKEWRQRIHLLDEIYTPGTRSEYEWEICSFPNDLTGKSFIDVGANDGMISFLAERKGAAKVTSVDLYVDDENTNLNMTQGWSIGRINKVKEIKKSSIIVKACSVYDLGHLNEQFDVVYCGNVIAWLSNPMEAISQLTKVTKKQLIIREDISKIKGKPVLEYVNNNDLTSCMYNGNKEFYTKYLKSLGFKSIVFKPVDEYGILERRDRDFPKFTIKENTKVYKNPFSDEDLSIKDVTSVSSASILVNNKYFFNLLGWVKKTDVEIYPYNMVPKNLFKKIIFEKKYRKNMINNCMIFAEK